MMSNVKNICVVTGNRADYDLLYPLLTRIINDDDINLHLVATGNHMSSEFGLTYKQIEDDGFVIDHKVEILPSSDTAGGVIKSMGEGLIGFAEVFGKIDLDIIILLGDRFEIFVAATAATVARIPIAHLSGGETTEGAFDEAFRHSITKMSHLHFTTTELYRNRVIQLGEDPKRVFNVGAFVMDNINETKLLSKDDLQNSMGFKFGKRNLLITFHPATLEDYPSEDQFNNLLTALSNTKNIQLIFTKSNSDIGGGKINKMIDEYVELNHQTAVSYSFLGRLRYLSTMQYIDGVVGNSSSGLVEAPSFKIGVVNIGNRQKGRAKSSSVIDCDSSISEIEKAIKVIFSKGYKSKILKIRNIYEGKDVSKKILSVIKSYNLDGILMKKFYDSIN
jgi:GDP/UDP-N,N'-diacetylbacillosamine 2-epimerase (hydrolysing)